MICCLQHCNPVTIYWENECKIWMLFNGSPTHHGENLHLQFLSPLQGVVFPLFSSMSYAMWSAGGKSSQGKIALFWLLIEATYPGLWPFGLFPFGKGRVNGHLKTSIAGPLHYWIYHESALPTQKLPTTVLHGLGTSCQLPEHSWQVSLLYWHTIDLNAFLQLQCCISKVIGVQWFFLSSSALHHESCKAIL